MASGQQPEQFELRDVGILKFVDENVAVLLPHLLEQGLIAAQQFHRLQNLRAKRVQVALAQQALAHAVDAREFFLPGDFLFGDLQRVGLERGFARVVLSAQVFDVALVIVRA